MVEIAEEDIETVYGGQIFVSIAQVILAELTGGISQRLQQLGNGRILLLKPDVGSWHSDFRQSGADRVLAANEAGAACGAALLRIIVGKGDAFFGDAVDVGRAIAHRSAAEMTDIPDTNVISPQDENVRLLGRHVDLLCTPQAKPRFEDSNRTWPRRAGDLSPRRSATHRLNHRAGTKEDPAGLRPAVLEVRRAATRAERHLVPPASGCGLDAPKAGFP